MDDLLSQDTGPMFSAALARKLLNVVGPSDPDTTTNKRISTEAARAAGHLLQLMVEQMIHKATIEAECEQEGNGDVGDRIRVRADHITKVAAEVLMDMS